MRPFAEVLTIDDGHVIEAVDVVADVAECSVQIGIWDVSKAFQGVVCFGAVQRRYNGIIQRLIIIRAVVCIYCSSARFEDRGSVEPLIVSTVRDEMRSDGHGTSGFTPDGDLLGVTSEGFDVLLDPFESKILVSQS